MGLDEQFIDLVKDVPETDLARAVLTTVREPLVILDGEMRVKWASAYFYANFRLKPEVTEGRLIYDLAEGQWNTARVRELFDKIIQGRDRVTDYEFAYYSGGSGYRTLNLNASTVFSESGDPQLLLLSIQDTTKRASEGGGQEIVLEHLYDKAVHLEKAKEELRSEIVEQLEQNNVIVQIREESEKSEEERAEELLVAKELIKEEIIEHQETEYTLLETARTVQTLSSRLLFSIENERKSISIELHDSIGANLTPIIYGLEDMLERAGPQQASELEDAISMVRAAVELPDCCR
jgi:signal transduction histidine kinase